MGKRELNADELSCVNGGILEDYGKKYIDMLIQNAKSSEGMGLEALVRKIEQMPPSFYDREIGPEATIEEVREYVLQNWDRFWSAVV